MKLILRSLAMYNFKSRIEKQKKKILIYVDLLNLIYVSRHIYVYGIIMLIV